MPTLGFIGLGNMGGPMAHNLAAAGHEVVCFDAAGTEALAPAGAPCADSAAEIAQRARIVFLCLPDGPVVLRVAREMADCPGRAVEDRGGQHHRRHVGRARGPRRIGGSRHPLR